MLTREELFELNIDPPDHDVFRAAGRKWDGISKPIDGLGDFEQVVARIAAIEGEILPSIDKRAAVIFCADNGVVEEGVSSSPVSVTAAQAVNMTRHKTGMSSIAAAFGCEIQVVDVGINRTPDGLMGDVDFASVAPKASFITPVPGGVGLLTVAMLMENCLDLAERKLG